MKRIALFLLLYSAVASLAVAQSTTTDNLDLKVKNKVATFKGRVSLFAKNLDTGETYALNADERVRTASTIKIAVMVEAFARVTEGKASWSDKLLLTKEKKVSGSGVLQEFSDGLQLTLRDAVNLMILGEVMWLIDNPAYLLMSELSELLVASLSKT